MVEVEGLSLAALTHQYTYVMVTSLYVRCGAFEWCNQNSI